MDICLMSLDDLGSIFGEQFVDIQLQSWEDTPLQLLINDLHIEINDFFKWIWSPLKYFLRFSSWKNVLKVPIITRWSVTTKCLYVYKWSH